MRPTVLIDVGANIGMSSLALAHQFQSLVTVVGIEAEKENYLILDKNYNLWGDRFAQKHVIDKRQAGCRFHAKWGVASSGKGDGDDVSSFRLPYGISASGTFAPTAVVDQKNIENKRLDFSSEAVEISRCRVQINDIVDNYCSDNNGLMIVKIDIEGGEEELMSNNVEWMSRTCFMTIEVHDRFGLPRSSVPLLKRLVEYDFAVVPDKDILHCFNRSLLRL
ncbi:hypothetical protein MIT9_P0259 [Methylomarinovum caldicuralii]|uniref:Methyltransferase FkbM domain-containing protein n=1 Tax=Methylomarinovum caldicuralii TaxID=438856 RepID=A0AAU9C0M7_9GAMM|nr:FkbM family methyltransferase [Methylomarinovum caldicuralii]BCX80685.1 hypothetical protein MIT9_P0259 [Methylomarinovum caldicuralii]